MKIRPTFALLALFAFTFFPEYRANAGEPTQEQVGVKHTRQAEAVPIIHAKLELIAGYVGGVGSSDGPLLQAQFGLSNNDRGVEPMGIVRDSKGNLFVADGDNHVIRKIGIDGMVSTLAGKAGEPGSQDGVGENARFRYPTSITVDEIGNIFVADTSNHTIRKITPTGIVTTVAGKAGAWGGQDGVGAQVRFYRPTGIVRNSKGNLYVVDVIGRIREISKEGVVRTVAGGGEWGYVDGAGKQARFDNPSDLAIDADGNILVADTDNSAIRKVTMDGTVTTLIRKEGPDDNVDGPIEKARISWPNGLAFDGRGNLYVTAAREIRRISPDGMVDTVVKFIDRRAPDKFGRYLPLERPGKVAPDNLGNLYVLDDGLTEKVDSKGEVTVFAGRSKQLGNVDGDGKYARFDAPRALALDSQSNIYVTDCKASTVRKITRDNIVTTVAGQAYKLGYTANGVGDIFSCPLGAVLDDQNGLLVVDSHNDIIRKIDEEGKISIFAGSPNNPGFVDGKKTSAQFKSVYDIVRDKAGNIFVIDGKLGSAVRKVDRNGNVSLFTGDPDEDGHRDGRGKQARFENILNLAIDSHGNLYVCDHKWIRKISPDGEVSTLGDYGYEISDGKSVRFGYVPMAISIDSHDEIIYGVGHKLRKLNAAGEVIAEIDATGESRLGLSNLSTLDSISAIGMIDDRSFAVIVDEAVLKVILPPIR